MKRSPGVGKEGAAGMAAAAARVFECKTCSRRFASFQALGGHRSSHKKPRPAAAEAAARPAARAARLHECAVCGLEFSVGQALGGHMRRHRAPPLPEAPPPPAAAAPAPAADGEEGRKGGGLGVDLNLTPVENDVAAACRGLRLVVYGGHMRMVYCSY